MSAIVDPEADDCEWVIERSKAFLKKKDHHGARAWMLTAKSLFPYRFIVQVRLGAMYCVYV